MVRISLTNKNKNSSIKTTALDFSKGLALLNQQEPIPLYEFKKLDFYHPLLSEPPLELQNEYYTYIYTDLAHLILAPRRVYATLLNVQEREQCAFQIIPGPRYEQLKKAYKIPFSSDYRKPAQTTINVDQLNKIITRVWQKKFQFKDKLILNAHFSFHELPAEIDGDALYLNNELVNQLLNDVEHFEQYELRYINHFIGFGLFTRQEIKKGECVSLYLGRKIRQKKQSAYLFRNTVDSLNMDLDSAEVGNMSRFINHAGTEPKSHFCLANLTCVTTNIFGIEILAFWALRDIKKGEQLLFNYGQEYFVPSSILHFKLNAEVVDPKGNKLVDNLSQKMTTLRLFAECGIKEAKFKLIQRYTLVTVFIVIFFIALHLI